MSLMSSVIANKWLPVSGAHCQASSRHRRRQQADFALPPAQGTWECWCRGAAPPPCKSPDNCPAPDTFSNRVQFRFAEKVTPELSLNRWRDLKRCVQRLSEVSTDWRWVNKMWHFCTMEYYSAIKRNGVLICATTWMNLEHDTSWKKPDTKGHIFHFYDTTRIGKSEEQTSDCQGRGECENDFWWVWDFFWDDENALKLDSGDGCTVMQIHEKSLNYLNTLKW